MYAQSNIPNSTQQRAKDIVQSVEGGGAVIQSISAIKNTPGLNQATLITFTDSNGVDRSVTMLPDGETLFLGKPIKWSTLKKQKQHASLLTPTPMKSDQWVFTNDAIKPSVLKNVFDDGQDASQVYFSFLSKASLIREGSETNPNQLYVMYDPQCAYCNKLFDTLRDSINSGHITVNWIPVISVSHDPFHALLMLSAEKYTNEEKINVLHALRNKEKVTFSLTKEEQENALNRLVKNTSLRSALKHHNNNDLSAGTPQVLFQGRSGQTFHFYGYSDTMITSIQTLIN